MIEIGPVLAELLKHVAGGCGLLIAVWIIWR